MGALPGGNEIVRGFAGAVGPFLGRERELGQVDVACKTLARGHGCVVMVSGEAGVGKTRFCDEVADGAREAGARVVSAQCWLDDGAPPLWPWQTILTELCGDSAADLLASDTTVADVGPDRFDRFVAVTDRLTAACSQSPVCLVIDDVHRADAGAILLMRFVARSMSRLPLVLLLSRRSPGPGDPAPEPRQLDELDREAIPIVLGPFDLAETTEFLDNHSPGPVDGDLVSTMFKVSGGNPLFLRRIARTIGEPGGERAMSGGVASAIEQALTRLSPDSQRILSVAAVLGSTAATAETAEIAGCDAVAVLDALDEGVAAGLVTMAGDGDGRFAFSHDLVRSTVENSLSTADRLEAHARAAAVVAAADRAAPTADRLARAAHHARSAAPRSSADARQAVSICQTAARAVIRSFAYEQADALLSAAVELHTSAGLGLPSARLLIEWAQAASLRGQMNAARSRYGTAVERAEAEGERALFADAALGLGGVWLDENRTAGERARLLGLYRRALADLPPHEPGGEVLRCRLVARLAAEAAFDGGPTAPLDAAVESVRRSGDPHALAEALSLSHHALFAPEHTRTRLRLAEELVRLTSETDQGVLSLIGLLWRTIDLIHLGDLRVTRALEVLRERATALGNQHILYYVGVIDVLRLNNQGRLADAEAEARRGLELGEEIGRVDRLMILAGQLAVIRSLQGRHADVLDNVAALETAPTLADGLFSISAVGANLAARAGEHERARAMLRRAVPGKLADVPLSRSWMAALVSVVETAAILEDRDLAGQAYDLLQPFADLPTIAGLAVGCLGSTERPLGLAASTLGHHDRAVEHLERAIAANEQWDSRPMIAIARADLAGALRRRDDASTHDHDRARALLERAITDATTMGMTGWVAAWEADLGSRRPGDHPALPDASPPASSHAPPDGNRADRDSRPTPRGVIRREGRRWVVAVDDRRVRVTNLVGMTYLAELLTNPGQRILAATLVGNGTEPARPVRHEILDDEARNAYGSRARELSVDLAEAEDANDLHRAELLRAELDTLVDELEAATGLNGHARHFPDDGERARTAVRKAITRAIDAIDDADHAVAEMLRDTISTGATCTYHPSPDTPVVWSTR